MLAYGQEKEKGRGRTNASNDLPPGDGYATKEGDILLGGFVYRQAAQMAVAKGRHLSEMSVEEKQKLALKICSGHMAEHRAVGPEYYKHWMKRAQGFARYHRIELPKQDSRESYYEYFRHVRQWTKSRDEHWPKLRSAVGTHLVFSPDPKMWLRLRAAGMDERRFLHMVLTQTMKEVGDWRRKVHGPDQPMGWVAGTHVHADGADGHPHIHVMVLKRDEKGKEVDWSGSSLKNRKGREQEPDQLREAKRLFQKNVERQYERLVWKEAFHSQHQSRVRERVVIPPNCRMRKLALGLRAVAEAMRPFHSRSPSDQIFMEMGSMIRMARCIQNGADNLPSIAVMMQNVGWIRSRSRGTSRDFEPEM